MARETNTTLLNRWIELWSGNLALADEIIGPSFVGHFPPTTSRSNEIHGPQALKEWIRMTLALFINVQLTLEGDPILMQIRLWVDGSSVVSITVVFQELRLLLGRKSPSME